MKGVISMDTKEVRDTIMFLENCIHRGEEDNLQAYEVKYNHWMKKIIKLLEEGEKYEAILSKNTSRKEVANEFSM